MNVKLIAKGKVAIISTSEHCLCLNVIFQNFSLHLTPGGLRGFKNQIDHNIRRGQSKPDCDDIHHLDTPYHGVALHFNTDELIELQKLIRRAMRSAQFESLAFDQMPSHN